MEDEKPVRDRNPGRGNQGKVRGTLPGGKRKGGVREPPSERSPASPPRSEQHSPGEVYRDAGTRGSSLSAFRKATKAFLSSTLNPSPPWLRCLARFGSSVVLLWIPWS